MRKRVNSFLCFLVAAILIMGILQQAVIAKAAISAFTVDDEVYNLWIDEVPEAIFNSSYISAKLSNSKLDPELYSLSLIDDAITQTDLQSAMKGAGLSTSEYRSLGMDITLYKYNEDDSEYYASDESKVDVICPIPDSFYDTNDSGELTLNTDTLKVVDVSTSGKLEYPDFKLVNVDDNICAMFQVTKYVTYGFIMAGKNEATPVPTKAATTNPTKAPTTAPKATTAPTSKPTATKTPEKSTSTPVPTVKVVDSSSTQNGEKDTTPKTGDSHSSTTLFLAGSISAAILITIYLKSKKQ